LIELFVGDFVAVATLIADLEGSSVWVGVQRGIISGIGISVPALRIIPIRASVARIDAGEPSLR
jgi:hypothetical protein